MGFGAWGFRGLWCRVDSVEGWSTKRVGVLDGFGYWTTTGRKRAARRGVEVMKWCRMCVAMRCSVRWAFGVPQGFGVSVFRNEGLGCLGFRVEGLGFMGVGFRV